MIRGTVQIIRPAPEFGGEVELPGDKSVSHRALILGSLASGRMKVRGLSLCRDVLYTIRCLRGLGVGIRLGEPETEIAGSGLEGLWKPNVPLDAGTSATTFRLLMGLLAGQSFDSRLTGEPSLLRRPLDRVAGPLRRMGARIETSADGTLTRLLGGRLRGIDFTLPVPSAQLKSAVLLAGLLAEGETLVREPVPCRDHTERMLEWMGARITRDGRVIRLSGGELLTPRPLDIPGDISAASFLAAAACVVPGGGIRAGNVLLNPLRTGFLDVLGRMGAEVETRITARDPEPVGRLSVRHAELKAATVEAEEVPRLIDELPLLAVVACRARGRTTVRGAGELRHKESDRIESTARMLKCMGVKVETFEDGFAVEGPQVLSGGQIDPMDDHRIAMSASVAALAAEGVTRVLDPDCARDSFPGFYDVLDSLRRK